MTIEGAGYWYSEVYRDVPLPNNTPLGAAFQCYSCQLENFHIDSDAMSRAEVDGGGGAEDTTGNNWLISGMWVQHVESSLWASGSGGTAQNNLFTVIFADGCNLNNVSLTGTSGSNLTATNNFIRGTGDDGMAINSVAYNGSQTYTAMSDITMSHNTVIAPWGGKGIGVYGGSGHLVEDNFISDTARYIGLGVGRFGVNGSDMLGATVTGNVIVRSGGNAYFQGQPALQIGNGGDGQNVGTVTDATVTGNTIINSVYDSIGFSTSTSTNLADNTITSPWRNGIVISPPFYPAPTGNATITGNSVTGVGSGFSAYSNDSSGFTATLSNNSWQTGSSEGPYGGTPAAVPGVVQAENYDTGGQGVAYNVTSTNGTGNSYRSDGIDLETTSDTGGGYDLGWTSGGQWFRYTVNAASAGTYTVSFRVAAPSAVTDALHLSSASGANLSGNVSIPATGGWQNWTTVTATVQLAAGQQTLAVDEDNGGWNLNYLSFAGSGGTSSPLTASPSALSFGSVTVGSTSPASTVTVSNPGTVAASVVVGRRERAVQPDQHLRRLDRRGRVVHGQRVVRADRGGRGERDAVGGVERAGQPADGGAVGHRGCCGEHEPGAEPARLRPAGTPRRTSRRTRSTGTPAATGRAPTTRSRSGSRWTSGPRSAVGRIVLDLPPSTSWGTRTQTITIQGSTDGSTYTHAGGLGRVHVQSLDRQHGDGHRSRPPRPGTSS